MVFFKEERRKITTVINKVVLLCESFGELKRGRRLSGYFQKGTAQYKNTTEGIHVSDKWIIKEYIAFLRENIYKLILRKRLISEGSYEGKIIDNIINNNVISFGGVNIKLEQFTGKSGNLKNAPLKDLINCKSLAHSDYVQMTFLAQDFEYYKTLYPTGTKKDWEGIIRMVSDREILTNTIEKSYKDFFDFFENGMDDFDEILNGLTIGSRKKHADMITNQNNKKQSEISRLEKRKLEIDDGMKTMRKNFLKMGGIDGMEEAFREEIKALEQEKKVLDEKIHEKENEEDFDLLIAKIPGILKNTFELLGKSFTEKENKDLKEDIYDLIKLTAFELKIKKKKALEIELFLPVRQVLFLENVCLEAPPGVEPGYEALQAPV